MKTAVFCAALLAFQAAASNYGIASLRVASGLQRPVDCKSPPGDSRRLFILEQHAGNVRILDLTNNTLLPAPFLTVGNLTRGNEQGLLGIAFHPKFATNGFFYLYTTNPGGGPAGHVEITRYKVAGDPLKTDRADPASRSVILTFDKPESNHNGGWIAFGPDGFMYLGTGDGGGGNDRHGPIGNGQNRDVLLAKILRIDVDHTTPPSPLGGEGPGVRGYAIPDGNPFKGDPAKRGEIWAFGIRNAWRCCFDRATGNIWVGDVGQDRREEIDLIPAGVGGLNFGWRVREGLFQNVAYPNEKTITPAVDPIFDYVHDRGNCIIGGCVYRGQAIPSLQGLYIFGDNGSSRLWVLVYDGKTAHDIEITNEVSPGAGAQRPIGNISSFGEDIFGEVYVCDLQHGAVHKIVPASASEPRALASGPLPNGRGSERPGPPAYLSMPHTADGHIPALLSQTGAFESVAKLKPNAMLVPYTVNVPFWSDGALKSRWIALPAGETAGFAAQGAWIFPPGTVFVKHFELNTDERNPSIKRRLETRLLVVCEAGLGYGVTYKWRADNSDAELLPDSMTEEIPITTAAGGQRVQKWYYPSRLDCLICHTVNAGLVLGVNTRQMNGAYNYPNGQANQLVAWKHLDMFNTLPPEGIVPAQLSRVCKPDELEASLELRARSYLDVNCGYCHRPGGAPSNMDARFDNPQGFQRLIGGEVNLELELANPKIVAPGDPANSMVLRRIAGLKNRMPPLARNEIDRAGVALLEEWIKSLPAKGAK